MDPLTGGLIAGGIQGGTSLLAALMQAEQAKKQRMLEGQMMAGQGEMKAIGDMSQGQQNALAQLMSAYRSIAG